MTRIKKFFHLTAADQVLFVQSTIVIVFSTLGLRIFPWLRLQNMLLNRARQQSRRVSSNRPSVNQIKWAVGAAGHSIPKASCLPQALTSQYLLVRNGYPADLQIGVARDKDGKLEAHAWVVSENQTVLGEVRELDRFIPLSNGDRQAMEHYGRSL